ncbi:MAG: esterase/lipase family protein, partial [Candidatus Binatia bacterium]
MKVTLSGPPGFEEVTVAAGSVPHFGAASASTAVVRSGVFRPGGIYHLKIEGEVEADDPDTGEETGGGSGEANWNVELRIRNTRPVLLLPGIGGTYAADPSNDQPWLLFRGLDPGALRPDPLTRVYDDLIQTLENAGYVDGKNLFVVNYDWRLPPGPSPASDAEIDGVVAGIDAASISDSAYDYAVDYLGASLRQAAERWESDYPGETLDKVDVITHSTGGLVARSYIQSPAYGAAYSGTKTLPKIENLIMVGVPNRGASKAFNPWHDNWVVDPSFQVVLSKIVNRAYQKVLGGETIVGPQPIDLASIGGANPDPIEFIHRYVPTVRSLFATYDFADFGTGFTNINQNASLRNALLLDLNNGLDLRATADPSPFAAQCKPTVIYGTNVEAKGGLLTPPGTPTTIVQRLSPPGGQNAIADFREYFARDARPGERWFRDNFRPKNGDGTVPIESSAGQFVGDDRVTLIPFTFGANTQEDVSHTGLMYNRDVQKRILETLGIDPASVTISTGLAAPTSAVASVLFDPVDGFLVDGAGRRLGFSKPTGALTEIPGSRWFGDADGMGLLFGPVQEPLRLELIGRDEPYYVMVAIDDRERAGGVIDSGFLAEGVRRTVPVSIVTRAATTLFAEALITSVPPASTLRPLTPTGRLTNSASGQGIEGRIVRFFAGDTLLCAEATDENGVASCGLEEGRQALLALGYDAVFEGDGYFLPASDHAQLA